MTGHGAAWFAQEAPMVPEGSPPWLVALGIIAALATTALTAWPLVSRHRRSRAPTEEQQEEPETAAAPRPAPHQPPIERADAAMALLERTLDRVERDQEADRAEAARLREANAELTSRVGRLETAVSSRDEQIRQLRATIDRLLAHPTAQPPPPPGWPAHQPQTPPGTS